MQISELSTKQWMTLGVVIATAAICYGWTRYSDDGEHGRIGLSGAVTRQGQPIESGRIQFTPAPDTAGPAVLADIENGAYEIPPQEGVFPGTYHIQITIGARQSKQPGPPPRIPATPPQTIDWPHVEVIDGEAARIELSFELE